MSAPNKSVCLTPLSHRGAGFNNRIGLAPLTRGRADFPSGCVNELHVEYYAQRATAGFILSEATGISRRGLGWWKAPGIYTDEQVEAWKPVTAAVHQKGGFIACQLWHMGRAGHTEIMGAVPQAPSAVPLSGEVTVANREKRPYEVPEAMTEADIKQVQGDYVRAARNAMAAGFDAVQVHSANGYLLDEFLQPVTNQREDRYGGSLENRLRMLDETLDAVVAEVGADKVWVRFSPNGAFQEMGHADNGETFDAAIELAAKKQLAVVEVLDGLTFGFHEKCAPFTLARTRAAVDKGTAAAGAAPGTTLVCGNCGHTQESADREISAGHADLISFGRPYMSNPDLPERFRDGVELAASPEYPVWWNTDGTEGYTSYPAATN